MVNGIVTGTNLKGPVMTKQINEVEELRFQTSESLRSIIRLTIT